MNSYSIWTIWHKFTRLATLSLPWGKISTTKTLRRGSLIWINSFCKYSTCLWFKYKKFYDFAATSTKDSPPDPSTIWSTPRRLATSKRSTTKLKTKPDFCWSKMTFSRTPLTRTLFGLAISLPGRPLSGLRESEIIFCRWVVFNVSLLI